MAVASVDIQVDGRGALQQLKAINAQSQQLQANSNAAIASLKNQSNQFNSLASGIRNLAAAYIGLQTAQRAVQAGIQREESGRRLQFLAKGYNEIAAAQKAAARSGRTFGLSTTEANQQFAQLYGRLRPLGVSLSDIESTFVGFNTTAKISGASASEASNAMTQLAQALGAGALRGDELNSVMEQAPGLVTALAKELDVPIGQIRKLASEGKLTSDVVIRALKSAGTDGADQLAAAMSGPAQAVKNLQNAVEDLQVAASKDLLPSIINTINGLTGLLQTVAGLPQPIKNFIGTLAGLALGMYAVHKAIQATIAIRATYVAAMAAMATSTTATGTAATASSSAFALYTRNTQALAAQATASTGQVTALGAALRSVASIGGITIAIDIVIRGATEAFATLSSLFEVAGKRGGMPGLPGNVPGGTRALFGGSATAEQQAAARATIARLQNQSLMQRLNLSPQGLAIAPQGAMELANAPFKALLQQQQIRQAQEILALPTRAAAKAPTRAAAGGAALPPATTGGGAAAGGKGKADDKAQQQQAIAAAQLQTSEAQRLYDQEGRILEARAAGNKQLEIARQAQAELLRINYEAQRLKQDREMPAAQRKAEMDQLAIKAATVARQLEYDINAERQAGIDAAAGAMKQLQDELGLQQARLNGTEAEYILNLQIRDLKAQFPVLSEAEVRAILNKTKALKGQADAAQELKDLYKDIGMSIKSGVVDAIQGAIDGTKTLGQVAADLLNNIANKLLDVAVNMALFGTMSGTGTGGGLLGGLFRANGGSVVSGQPYIVGERGPELFMPGRSGTIIPNHNLGGGGISVVVNVDASGSSVSGDQAQGKQLGLAVSAAVQAELLKHKRPGGLLA